MTRPNDRHVLRISTGGRNRGRVKNVTVSWGRFCRQFEQPSVDQSVTYAQYLALSQDEQHVKKAAPGFIVGAHFEDGVRRLRNMQGRALLSFDLDALTRDQAYLIESGLSGLAGYECLIHSTRKHCREKPRLRVHMPLARLVDHEEANALTRIVASRLFDDPQESVDAVDVVSHRFAQVSYLPSVSRGQEYLCQRHEGKILDPDEVLASFDGWQDHTRLPMRSDEKTARAAAPGRKMEDPREKPGVIGAFCRAYSIEEAIAEFIPDVYVPGTTTDEHPRYSYAAGTSSNGAVVYDDGLFITSHHGSDPLQGSANAFDMVRVHKFGHLDAGLDDDTPPGKLPSFKKMTEWASSLDRVRAEMVEARLRFADAFDDDDEGEGESAGEVEDDIDLGDLLPVESAEVQTGTDPEIDALLAVNEAPAAPFVPPMNLLRRKPKPEKDWKKRLKIKPETGQILDTVNNVKLILANAEGFAGTQSFDLFRRKLVTRKPLGFKALGLARVPIPDETEGRPWLDQDSFDRVLVFSAPAAQGGFDMEISSLDMKIACSTAAYMDPFHPVLDRIEAVRWDGTERALMLFINYLGLENTAYHREVCRIWLLAAMTRLHEPGAKFDYVPIFMGKQGIRKSSFVEALAWGNFGELPPLFDQPTRMIESMFGCWIMEIPELSGFRKAEAEALKAFFSATHDTARLAYRTNEETYPRQVVFAGTTNKDSYLKDETGNRRFWPVKVQAEQIDIDGLARIIPQVWAEVRQWYLRARREQPFGPLKLFLRDPEAIKTALSLQEEAVVDSPAVLIGDQITRWLEQPVSETDAAAEEGDGWTDGDGSKDRMLRRTRFPMPDLWQAALGHPRPAQGKELVLLAEAAKHVRGWTRIRKQIGDQRKTWLVRDGSNWLESPWEPVPGS